MHAADMSFHEILKSPTERLKIKPAALKHNSRYLVRNPMSDENLEQTKSRTQKTYL